MHRLARLTALLATLPALLLCVEALAAESISAVRDETVIRVTGKGLFTDRPQMVASDPALDAAPGLGVDVTALTIARPDFSDHTLVFSMEIRDQPPALGGVPEIVHHFWWVHVGNQDGSIARCCYLLSAFRLLSPTLEPSFRLFDCQDLPSGCGPGRPLEGKMEQGVVQFEVPAHAINASPGGVIAHGWRACEFRPDAGADATLLRHPPGPDPLFFSTYGSLERVCDQDRYVIPEARVGLGIAPAGTPEHEVPITATASVRADGQFEGSLPTPNLAGKYAVVARACYGAENCTGMSTEITI